MDAAKKLNIFEKMAAITSELQTVAKNLDVETGKGKSYKAVSERDILDAVKPLEQKYGIYSYPCDREILEAAVLESENTYNGRTTKKSTFFTRMKTTYKFVNIEEPSEFITTITFSEGIDTQDKGSGKAMTYADKYALMKAYKISTGDDPDQDPSQPENYQTPGGGNGRLPWDDPQPPPPPEIYQCAMCGKDIKATILKDGRKMQPADVANFSIQRFGRQYCSHCQKAIKAEQKRQTESGGFADQGYRR